MTVVKSRATGGDALGSVAAMNALAVNEPAAPRRLRFMWLWFGVWLVYMVQPLQDSWRQPHLWQRIVGVTAALAFCAVYLIGFMRLRALLKRTGQRFPLAVSWSIVAVMTVLAIVLMVAIGQSGLGSLIYVAVMAAFTLPIRAGWIGVATLAVTMTVVQRIIPGWRPNDGLTFQLAIAALAGWGVVHLVERNAQLAAAREEIARLAVAEERNRFARDLHDLLGHSLTLVAIKAELASRLIRLAPERAEAEIADVQRLAREALADVRSAVGGYREVSLGAELARARSALTAAGIEAELPTATSDVPEDRHELFGWAVREGITNVVRHSEAKHCRVRLTAREVEITDDGHGPGTEPVNGVGHGLVGLRERVAAIGGTLTVGRSAEGGFALRIGMP
ncbi:MAG: sensor histidine kinase [Mycobacterium sp.]|nr:sensor histidine kinase [Mycobacterium sp.]